MEDVPDSQVPERARQRTDTAKYKAEVLAAYEACDREAKVRCCAERGCTPR